MPLRRRDFLAGGALVVASGITIPAFLARTATALHQQRTAATPGATPVPTAGRVAAATSAPVSVPTSNKTLVVLQLSGGNDGLDTVIPFADPGYASLRGSLAVPTQDVVKLNDSVGLNPDLSKLKAFWDQGTLAVVQGVGYPNPNRSHFRSMDIWHSARPDILERTGWLGRYLGACQCAQEGIPAISVGPQLNSMFWTDTVIVPAIASIGSFSFFTDTKYKNDRTYQLQTLHNIYSQAGNWSPYEKLIRGTTVDALSASDALQKVASSYSSPVTYPKNNGLASQLQLVAQVIAGDLGTRVFSVAMGGFDTHAMERTVHQRLFPQIGEALTAFQQDLAHMNRQDDVLILMFTEFGRRAKPNASGGTDHGTAEPVFLLGNAVRGGLYGTYPSLEDLDANGDLKFSSDFRSVYAGVLQNWLGVDPAAVLAGGTFQPMQFLKASPTAAAA